MRSIILLFIIQSLSFCQINVGSIKGKVLDTEYNYKLIGAHVVDIGHIYSDSIPQIQINMNQINNYGATADANGDYLIKNLPLGIYIIRCSDISYMTVIDTIEITANQPTVIKNYDLKVLKYPILMPDFIRAYHNLFSKLSPQETLSIIIDSVNQNNNLLYLTFQNNCKYPLYIIKDKLCFSTISVIIRDEDGKKIKANLVNLGCDVGGMNYLPQRSDLLRINPFKSIKLPATEIYDYSLKKYPPKKGNYYLQVRYKIYDYKYIYGLYAKTESEFNRIYKDEIEVLNQATRGEYFSENEIEIKR